MVQTRCEHHIHTNFTPQTNMPQKRGFVVLAYQCMLAVSTAPMTLTQTKMTTLDHILKVSTPESAVQMAYEVGDDKTTPSGYVRLRCSHLDLNISPASRDLIQCKPTQVHHILRSRTPRKQRLPFERAAGSMPSPVQQSPR